MIEIELTLLSAMSPSLSWFFELRRRRRGDGSLYKAENVGQSRNLDASNMKIIIHIRIINF